MAQKTPFLQLNQVGTTPSDLQMSVREWRLGLNGYTNDNMSLIDTFASTTKNQTDTLNGSKYDDVTYNSTTGQLTFKANGVNKTTVQSSNPNLVKLNGENQEVVNFIENQVVQDGLTFISVPPSTSKEFDTGEKYTLTSVLTINTFNWVWIGQYPLVEGEKTWGIYIESPTGRIIIRTTSDGVYVYSTNLYVNLNEKAILTVTQHKSGEVFLSVNDKTERVLNKSLVLQTKLIVRANEGWSNRDVMSYNRQLSQQEINHNFSVLNNSPSLKSLETTDTTGKKQELLLATDSDHVEMRTGRTLEQEYMGVLKTMGKEFASADGADVTVANGVEARVIGAEIQGQTVKNVAVTNSEQKTISTTNQVVCNTLQCDSNKDYTVIMFVDEMENGAKVRISLDSGYVLPAYERELKIGINSFLLNQTVTQGKTGLGMLSTSSFKARNFMVIEGDVRNKVASYIPFGLSSTVTTISNNGIKYPLYASLEDKAQKKQILLGGVGGVNDTLTLNSDGSLSGVSNFESIKLNKDNLWIGGSSVGATIYKMSLYLGNAFASKPLNECISNCVENLYNNNELEHFYIDNGTLNLFLKATNEEEFKAELGALGVIIMYRTSTQTTYAVDKSVNEPIATTSGTSLISVGEAVKPSSYTITIPTTDEVKQDFTLSPLNGWTGNASASLLQNGSGKLMLNVTAPSVYNQTICTLPQVLRPKVSTTVLGFKVDNTPIAIVIGTDGSVKCLATITGGLTVDSTYNI
ncbi:MAG: hypothetical protein ACRCX8_14520 [Sarcina sp.]